MLLKFLSISNACIKRYTQYFREYDVLENRTFLQHCFHVNLTITVDIVTDLTCLECGQQYINLLIYKNTLITIKLTKIYGDSKDKAYTTELEHLLIS